MLTPGIVKKLESDSDWQYLEKYINDIIFSLNSLDGIDFSDKEKAAIEGRARELAQKKLKEILEPFGDNTEFTTDKKKLTQEKTGVL